ncbi:siphovirus Gp157 family protein [Bacillus paranthracis]|nr:siphovirus Gp157 family protein [Bacillus paranthracis]
MTNLYTLTGQYLELQNMIEDGVDPEVLTDTLEAVEEAIETKAENIIRLVKNQEATVEAIKNEKKRLDARQKALENSNKRLKDYLFDSMKVTGNEKIKTDLVTISIKKNPKSVKVTDITAIPALYFKEQEPTLDKKKVLDNLKKGIEIEGAEIQQSESISIR